VTHRKKLILVATAAALSAVAMTAAWPRNAARVATGFVSHTLCSAAFVSRVDPAEVYADTTDAMPGVGLIGWALDYDIDRARKTATTTLLGGAASRAVYREGLGCMVDNGNDAADASLPPSSAESGRPLLPDIAGPSLVPAATPELARAVDRAFAEPEQPPLRHTKAVVIVKDGRVIAERYAPGIGLDTPMLGFSATKSVTSALIGILVRQGKFALHDPAPIAAWHNPGDPRHAISIDHLLRHTSGLAMGSSLNASLLSAFDPVNQMKYVERDMAGFAERASLEAAPGALWNYHDGNYLILSRLDPRRGWRHRRRRDALRLARIVRPAWHARCHI
jgi:hypothetical protein